MKKTIEPLNGYEEAAIDCLVKNAECLAELQKEVAIAIKRVCKKFDIDLTAVESAKVRDALFTLAKQAPAEKPPANRSGKKASVEAFPRLFTVDAG